MAFNSLSFLLFIVSIFALYWGACDGKTRRQNLLLLFASYFFYSCWDYRFLFLLILSTFIDFFFGAQIETTNHPKHRKIWLICSLIINLGILGIFKYYNFFSENLAFALQAIGFQVNFQTLQIILPIGISFYTFHGVSYVIDIYYKKINAERNFITYGLFVSFFPLLIAGPIERATHLLPQINKQREFNYDEAIMGLRQILWGLFKKIVIADSSAEFVNAVFANEITLTGSTLTLGIIFFAFQLYGDFSGYSDIALGTARLLGFQLLKNFSYPYFSRTISEFWKRWHISLTNWFRDYVFLRLPGNKKRKLIQIKNTCILFLLSGLWHGAKWTYLCWGGLNALYMIPTILKRRTTSATRIVAQGKILPSGKELFQMITTFSLSAFAGIFFRSPDIGFAARYIAKIFSWSFFTIPDRPSYKLIIAVTVFFMIEWVGREQPFAIANFAFHIPRYFRIGIYYVLLLVVLIFAYSTSQQQFVYFQF